VAREAGLSRSTLYRAFPGGREQLMAAVIGWEYDRFFGRLYDAVHDAPTLAEVLERGLAVAHRAIAEHAVLQRILATEPDRLVPALSVRSEPTRRRVAEFLVPYLERERLAPGVGVPEAADFLARMVLSFMAAPGRWDLDDRPQVSRLVRAELLGGILPPSG
jgi:AcrR family transcriptional regulator